MCSTGTYFPCYSNFCEWYDIYRNYFYLIYQHLATELSGGEAQRIKLATELQRTQHGDTLYILDKPTTGLHPADVSMLMAQLNGLVDAGNSVIMVEHDMQVASNSDWVIDVGSSAGDEGGLIVAQGSPKEVAKSKTSRTAPFLLTPIDWCQS